MDMVSFGIENNFIWWFAVRKNFVGYFAGYEMWILSNYVFYLISVSALF